MIKKIALKEKQEESSTEGKKSNKTDNPFSSKSFFATYQFPYDEIRKAKKTQYYSIEKHIIRYTEIFHPPQFHYPTIIKSCMTI